MTREFFVKRYKSIGGDAARIEIKPTLRVNTLRARHDKVIERLATLGTQLVAIPFLRDGFTVVKSRVSPGATTEHLLGYYYLQEAAAQVPAQVLGPKPGELVLDCCASPGGKTTQMAALMENSGTIHAYELKNHRIEPLLINLERMGVTNTLVFDKDFLDAGESVLYDRILVDAPCSGNYAGDARWFEKRDYDGVMASQSIQQKLLAKAVRVLKPGGILVYSTCSLEPEENELNIDWLVKNFQVRIVPTGLTVGSPGVTLVQGKKLDPSVAHARRFWPAVTGTEGFFVAKVQKC